MDHEENRNLLQIISYVLFLANSFTENFKMPRSALPNANSTKIIEMIQLEVSPLLGNPAVA